MFSNNIKNFKGVQQYWRYDISCAQIH